MLENGVDLVVELDELFRIAFARGQLAQLAPTLFGDGHGSTPFRGLGRPDYTLCRDTHAHRKMRRHEEKAAALRGKDRRFEQ